MPTPEESERTIARLRDAWEALVGTDGKCYFPCYECRGLKRRRVVRKTTEKHCFTYGHCEGGHTFRPMVSYSLYMSLY
jgi:hypothetical protein